MKEITIVNVDKMGFGNFNTETIKFMFDGYEGRFIKTTLGDPSDCEIEYEAGYLTGYAAWNATSDHANTCFGNTSMDLSEFMKAFKEKFGIEIPTV